MRKYHTQAPTRRQRRIRALALKTQQWYRVLQFAKFGGIYDFGAGIGAGTGTDMGARTGGTERIGHFGVALFAEICGTTGGLSDGQSWQSRRCKFVFF